ncbi:hypothetical protein [uncultured Algimonas sp.]|uniref:hypothetical protein n=1 Tax=uncultured Algimonas sp. TaxID=1547920 RepID=UPI0026271205|nr:hypothetical protein [uncultured Algimonas sp.]
MKIPFAIALLAAFVAPVLAQDAPEPLGRDYCFETADMTAMLRKFDGLKDRKRDTVGAEFALGFDLQDGEALPERAELRDGTAVTPIAFDAHHRSTGLTPMLAAASDAAELCIVDPARAGRRPMDMGYRLNMGLGIRFLRTPGTHGLAEIEDGLKDGRSHYKKMAGAMGFMVPKFDHVAVAGRDEDNPPRLWATADGADIGEPAFTLYDGARLVDVDVLEAMGADGIRIADGYYRLSPSPDAETVAKFSGGED